MISRIVCLVLIVGFVNAATFMNLNPKKPKEFANKPGCYIKEINDVIPYGETISPVGYCYSIDCSRHVLFYSSCGTVGTDSPNCYVTDEDLSVSYPDCCPQVKCEEDNYIL